MSMDMLTQTPPRQLQTDPIPALERGDRLTRDEFERRYAAMAGHVKAELIEGVVYMASPVKHPTHSRPHGHLMGWLFVYMSLTPGVDGGDSGTLRLDLDNENQPDGFLRIPREYRGQSLIDADGYVQGAPELVAEVAASSASYDLHNKLNAYRRNQVREYVVWRALDRAIDWFALNQGRFDRLAPDPDGLFRSRIFPGLWLDTTALLTGDLAAVIRRVQLGAATPEHAAFVEHLRRAASNDTTS
jgi:Uma2 family endonuclease